MNPFIEHDADEKTLGGTTRYAFRFANGYSASVVQTHRMASRGSWEVAVLDADERIDRTTSITNDVAGCRGVAEVREILRRIAMLPALAEGASR